MINVGDLEKVFETDTINRESFLNAGLTKKKNQPIKILGDGELKKSYTVEDIPVSKSAKEKIEKAGGKIVGKEDE